MGKWVVKIIRVYIVEAPDRQTAYRVAWYEEDEGGVGDWNDITASPLPKQEVSDGKGID